MHEVLYDVRFVFRIYPMKFQVSRFFWAPIALFLVSCESTQVVEDSPSKPSITSVLQLEKSPNDTRDYRYLELVNGLKVVLISDQKADKAAASLTAFRGSFHDPSERLGLAHFLEHMLFIGTKSTRKLMDTLVLSRHMGAVQTPIRHLTIPTTFLISSRKRFMKGWTASPSSLFRRCWRRNT